MTFKIFKFGQASKYWPYFLKFIYCCTAYLKILKPIKYERKLYSKRFKRFYLCPVINKSLRKLFLRWANFFCFLGSTINNKGTSCQEIHYRLTFGREAMKKKNSPVFHFTLCRNKSFSLKKQNRKNFWMSSWKEYHGYI